MMEKLRKIVQPKLMAVSLLLSVFMGDYIFCHIVGEWIELGIIFLLLAHSSVIVKDCSPSAYLNAIFTNCLTIALYLMARHFLKDSFFKDMLIFFFLCSLPFFIATLFLKNESDCPKNCTVFFDIFLIVAGIIIFCFFSSGAKIRFSKNYHLAYMILMQCFAIYPAIFIATKIFRKIKNVRRKRERRFSKGK